MRGVPASVRRPVLVWLLSAVAVAAAAAAVACLGWHVRADESPTYGSVVTAGPTPGTECGSAYTVLLKGNAYRGGEIPSNQAVIDGQCGHAARVAAAGAAACAGVAVIASVGGVAVARRAS